ncbi:hypothetical protein DFH27DRAFT_481879 [Peziza echinospora]|nr:hypothetical protein DFH27DRAFT_481879 [Peziza echinospora]
MASEQRQNRLPREVITCLKNARYLHLATSDGLWPHVSLMNYTYLPSSPYALPPIPGSSNTADNSGPLIILTTQLSTKKTQNLASNPRVSLLVHDWVSHRPSTSLDPTSSITNPTMQAEQAANPSSPRAEQSSLAALLTNLNTAELSSISATLNGYATIVPHGSEEEEYYKTKHLENNPQTENRCYLVGSELRVVVVRVGWVRVSDYRGGVKDYECVSPGTVETGGRFGIESGHFGAGLSNGTS